MRFYEIKFKFLFLGLVNLLELFYAKAILVEEQESNCLTLGIPDKVVDISYKDISPKVT